MEEIEKEQVRARRLLKKFFKTQIDAAKVLRQMNAFIQDEQPKPLEYATPDQFKAEVTQAADLPSAEYVRNTYNVDSEEFWNFSGKVRRMEQIVKAYEKEYGNVKR